MKASRATNYSPQEDIQLCESWGNISTDPITGNEQPGKAYWKRIHDNYHANKKFESTRTVDCGLPSLSEVGTCGLWKEAGQQPRLVPFAGLKLG